MLNKKDMAVLLDSFDDNVILELGAVGKDGKEGKEGRESDK